MKVEIGKDFYGDDAVVLNAGQFKRGGPIRYFYFPPCEAIELAEQLIAKAKELQERIRMAEIEAGFSPGIVTDHDMEQSQ